MALCNAVGDRYQAIGMNRPNWPVNTAASDTMLTIGTKSATLVDDDLLRLDLFRYDWWGLIASQIQGLLSPSYSGPSAGASVQCKGFCTTSGGNGLSASRWGLSALESDVGLGAIGASSVGGSSMHLFDEVAPTRLREMLDRLIYPVVHLPAPGAVSASDHVESGLVDHVPGGDNAGDVWRAMASDPGSPFDLRAVVTWTFSSPHPRWLAYQDDNSTWPYDMTDTPNGVGPLGSILSQYYVVEIESDHLITATVAVSGDTFSGSGTGTTQHTLTGVDLVNLNTTTDIVFSWDSIDATNSPFNHTSTSGGYTLEDYGFAYARPAASDLGSDYNSRVVLDISAACADQT